MSCHVMSCHVMSCHVAIIVSIVIKTLSKLFYQSKILLNIWREILPACSALLTELNSISFRYYYLLFINFNFFKEDL